MRAQEPAPYRPAGTLDLRTALEPYRGPWTERLAAHLLRRAGFGGTPTDIARFAALDMNAAVDALVTFPDTSSLPAMPPVSGDADVVRAQVRARFAGGAALDPQARRALVMQFNKARRQEMIELTAWWLTRMATTPAPLQEKMTLFMHGHFTSAALKNISGADMAEQNDLFRQNALGNWHALTLAVSKNPAMLKYLDNARNEKAHPNENYARELMELFTLGIGNYTETDVRESARAFTGWTVRPGEGFVFNARQHDDGQKTFLGQTGNFDGTAIVDIIFQQPAAATFLANKLISYFIYSDPEPEFVDAVARVIRKHNFELKPVMATLLASNVFYSPRAYRALVKSPVEYIVGAHQAFGVSAVDKTTIGALRSMDQIPFYPPSVKGWDGGAAWLNSQTMLARANFANALMSNAKMPVPAWLTQGLQMSMTAMDPNIVARRLTNTLLIGDVSPAATAHLVSYLGGADQSALASLSVENFDERLRGAAYLTMAMPAYQLN
jgi:uncharacterized protein (DUF1800 family)